MAVSQIEALQNQNGVFLLSLSFLEFLPLFSVSLSLYIYIYNTFLLSLCTLYPSLSLSLSLTLTPPLHHPLHPDLPDTIPEHVIQTMLHVIQSRTLELVAIFNSELRNPNIKRSEKRKFVKFLIRIGKKKQALDEYLFLNRQIIRSDIRSIEMSGEIEVFVNDLSKVFFRAIQSTTLDFYRIFDDDSLVSALVSWTVQEVTTFGDLLVRQVFNVDDLSLTSKCLKTVFSACKALEKKSVSCFFSPCLSLSHSLSLSLSPLPPSSLGPNTTVLSQVGVSYSFVLMESVVPSLLQTIERTFQNAEVRTYLVLSFFLSLSLSPFRRYTPSPSPSHLPLTPPHHLNHTGCSFQRTRF